MDSIYAKHIRSNSINIAAVNKTIHENLSRSRIAGDNYHKGQNEGWTNEQILSLGYVIIGSLVIVLYTIILYW